MAKETERYFVVRVLCDGKMLKDGGDYKYASLVHAKRRAAACAGEGEYAEVHELVTTERCIERFETTA